MLLLITGASGVGKTTARRLVAPSLPETVESAELTDVLTPRDGFSLIWRQQAAEEAVLRAVQLQREGRHLLLAGDPIPAIEVVAAPSSPRLDALAVCLLDADAEAQASRLAARREDPTLLAHHQAFAEWMRRQATDPLHMTHVVSDQSWEEMRWDRLERVAEAWRMETVDTSALTPQEVAAAVLDWCGLALDGGAPSFRVDRS
jgi:hypothetical protein